MIKCTEIVFVILKIGHRFYLCYFVYFKNQVKLKIRSRSLRSLQGHVFLLYYQKVGGVFDKFPLLLLF